MNRILRAYEIFTGTIGMLRATNRLRKAKRAVERERLGLPPLEEVAWYSRATAATFMFTRVYICGFFCPCCLYDRYRYQDEPRTLFQKALREGTPENEFCKSIIGFLSGIFLSSVVFFLLFYKLDITGATALGITLGLGFLLTIILALAETFRCIILLMVPSLFSSTGRNILILYAFILVVSVPGVNFTHNMQVMSQTAACGQMMAYNQSKDLIEMALAPVRAISDDLENVLEALVKFAQDIRIAFVKVKKIYAEVFAAINRVKVWLKNMVDVCNENMGTPYRKCKGAFDNAVKDCRDKMGILNFLCEIANWVSHICNITRIGEILCLLTKYITDYVLDYFSVDVRSRINSLMELFKFNVTMTHYYNVTIGQSKTYDEIKEDIITEVRERTSYLRKAINFGEVTVVLMLIWLFIKSALYRRSYLSKDGFDNYYISFRFRDIDWIREDAQKETVLPLEWHEKENYISPQSLRMVGGESTKLVTGMVFWAGTVVHAAFYLCIDYGLYWLLDMLRRHGDLKRMASVPSHLKMHVQGDAIMADMYRELITLFDPMGRLPDSTIDTQPCLPNPSVPDYATYEQIVIIFAITLVLIMTQAYGLRLRHLICGCYYPYREQARAVWLYNQILHRRGGFLKYMRRMIRKKLGELPRDEERSVQARLAAASPIMRKVLEHFGYERKFCLACAKPGTVDDYDNFKHCVNESCQAVYCLECFTDINNICSACMNPVDYGDASDFSEEQDSSDEEMRVKIHKQMEAELAWGSVNESDDSLEYDYQSIDSPTDSSSEYEYEKNIKSAARNSVNLVKRRKTIYESVQSVGRQKPTSSESIESLPTPAQEPIKGI